MALSNEQRDELSAVADQIDTQVEAEGFASLTEPEQMFHAIWLFTAEVNSGGADSYYFYRGADLATETVHALRAVGAAELAALLESANQSFSSIDIASIDARQEFMQSMSEQERRALGQRFIPVFSYDPEPDLWLLLTRRRAEFTHYRRA